MKRKKLLACLLSLALLAGVAAPYTTVSATEFPLPGVEEMEGYELSEDNTSIVFQSNDTIYYTGEEICPKFTLIDEASGDEIPESFYDISYEDNIKVGTASITVTGKAPATGSATFYFKIHCVHDFLKKQEDGSYQFDRTKSIGHYDANCGENEKYEYQCSDCEEIVYEEIPDTMTGEHEFEYSEEESTEPTCTEAGYDMYICGICGQQEERNKKEALRHDFKKVKIIKEATCKEDGLQMLRCSRCGEEDSEDIPATGEHDWAQSSIPPKCGTDGTLIKTCKNCGEIEKSTIPATGEHRWKETSRTEPTCAKDGSVSYQCQDCKETKSEVLQKTGKHQLQLVGQKDATCVKDGYTGDEICKVCEETISEGDIIPATGEHTYGKPITKQPTCTESGYQKEVCLVCGDEVITTEGYEALGHEFEVNSKVDPTVGEDGYIAYDCVRCGETKREVLPMITTIEGCSVVLSKAIYEFDAKGVYKPLVTLYRGSVKIPENLYTVEYVDNDKIGTAKVILTGVNGISGVVEKEFSIIHSNHNAETKITKAAPGKVGKEEQICKLCKETVSEKEIAAPDKLSLSSDTFTYNGKVKSPEVLVTDTKGNRIYQNAYQIVYESDRKSPGKHQVTVKFQGRYEGSLSAEFVIYPKTMKLKSLKKGKRSFTAKWSKPEVSGCQLQYSKNKKFKGAKTVDVSGKTSKTIKKVKGKYYVRIRCYTVSDGEKYYSGWSSYKTVTPKK